MESDMTQGRVLPKLLRFMTPIIIGNIFQQLYNITDMLVAGRYIGANAVAAVGAVGSLMFLLLGFMMGLTAGCSVITAQRYGAGDIAGVKRSVAGAFIISAALAVVGTIVGILSIEPILRFIHMPEEIFNQGRDYILIIYAGLAVNMLYNLVASLLRAVGNSKMPLYFLMLSVAISVALDFLFVIVIPLGVAGTALATVIAQAIAGTVSLLYMIKKVPILRISLKGLRPDWQMIKKQFNIGIPMALQFSVTAAGVVIIQGALNTFGTDPVAAYAAANKLEQLVDQPIFALGVAAATYAAQNTGKSEYGRIKRGTLIMAVLVGVYSIIAAAVGRFIMPYAISITVANEVPERINNIVSYANIYAVNTLTFIILLSFLILGRNVLQGCGYSIVPLIGAGLELTTRILIATKAAAVGDFGAVCFAQPVTWGVTSIFLWIVFAHIFRKKGKRTKEAVA